MTDPSPHLLGEILLFIQELRVYTVTLSPEYTCHIGTRRKIELNGLGVGLGLHFIVSDACAAGNGSFQQFQDFDSTIFARLRHRMAVAHCVTTQ